LFAIKAPNLARALALEAIPAEGVSPFTNSLENKKVSLSPFLA
jgi:hypothetical protein